MIARLSIVVRLVAEHARYRMALEAIAANASPSTPTAESARARKYIARQALGMETD